MEINLKYNTIVLRKQIYRYKLFKSIIENNFISNLFLFDWLQPEYQWMKIRVSLNLKRDDLYSNL